MTLGDLLKLTGPARLWLPVQPGYPAITIGGCIAANVHGKNPAQSGTFRHSVIDVTLFHPAHGTLRVSASKESASFDLTCGGYGLTGIILAATLRLAPLPGTRLSRVRIPLRDLQAGLACVRATPPDCAFTYTWQDAAPGARPFGRGIAYRGTFVVGAPRPRDVHARYWRLRAAGARLPVSGWNRWTAGAINWGYRVLESAKPDATEISLFDSLFPFARRPGIFLLFGRCGFVEYQTIVSDDRAEYFLERLERLLGGSRLPSVLLSMKRFAGTQRHLRFERDGVSITLMLKRSKAVLAFLPSLDQLVVETGGLPNIIKDSRLPGPVVKTLYPEYEVFRRELNSYDPRRLFRSELSERLEV
jgi:decaprenylphospho-beta-D-ribofuranose 2-oxidase